MKHFFKEHEEKQEYTLLSLFTEEKKFDEIKNGYKQCLFKYLKQELCNNIDDLDECIIKQFKILYDAADIIYDKRLDKYDWELDKKEREKKNNITKNNGNNGIGIQDQQDEELKVFLDNSIENNKEVTSLREKALTELWNYAEHELSRYKFEFKEKEMVYSCLAKGNICHRLSNLFFDNYDLKASDMWGSRANELLWHGKNLIEKLCRDFSEKKDDETQILKLLVTVNLAKYYRDYASRNRRSDFVSAEELFKDIITSIEDIDIEQLSEENKRQLAMLYVEAERNLISMSNRRRIKDSPNLAEKFAMVLSEKYINSISANGAGENGAGESDTKKPEELKNYVKERIQEFLMHGSQIVRETKLGIDMNLDIMSHFKDYDAKRMLILSLLLYSKGLRGEHEPEKYKKAIEIADVANMLSQVIDDPDNGAKNVNIDALIIISSSLRKYCIYSNTNIPQNLLDIVLSSDNGNNNKECLNQLFVSLKRFADNGHLSSKTELIKWYCMSLDNRRWYAEGDLPTILNWTGFPDEDYINQLFKNDNNNALMEFYRGKVLLDSSNYRQAIKVLKKLLVPQTGYNSVAYYVRTGTIGLKARYLMANAYMSLGKYYQAMVIFKDAYNSLKIANDMIVQEHEEQKKDKKEENTGEQDKNGYWSESGYPDLRILIDLAYCYIKRGAYDDAFKLYDDVYFVKQKKGGNKNVNVFDKDFLQKLPKSKRIAGVNNLITCCILSDKTEMQQYGKKLLDEIDNLKQVNSEQNDLKHFDFSNNPETNLLFGYRKVLEGKYADAQEFFSKLCQKTIAYRAKYITGDNKQANLGALFNNVEYISAYLINIIILYKERVELNNIDPEKEIKDFLIGLPDNRLLSLKAAIALAKWLVNYEVEKSLSTEIDSLYRYFSYIKIYEERGAGAFNRLYEKNNGQYRLFRSVERGKILAHLLVLYHPINRLKEMCTYSHASDDFEQRHLVHYTSLDTLKALIGKKKPSHFRLSNCDYANDLFEGRVFFDFMENTLFNYHSIITLNRLKQEYFNLPGREEHFTNREKTVHAIEGSDVYIGSFSLMTDSFPMWTIYSQAETGCNIEFGEGFFDVFGNADNNGSVKRVKNSLYDEFLPSRYTDSDYPLYYIQYIEKSDSSSKPASSAEGQLNKSDVIIILNDVFDKWNNLDHYLNGELRKALNSSEVFEKGVATVKCIAADLINEIRFLFKNTDFSYESEVRIVYTDSKRKSKIDYDRKIPMNYVEVNRKLENLTVTLGSKLSYSDADRIETWLKNTGLVKQINLAITNRKTAFRNNK